MKTGIELIAQELTKQDANCFPIGHHLQLNDNNLLEVAANAVMLGNPAAFPDECDDDSVVNICNKSKIDRLIIAGSFIARLIDNIKNQGQ